MIWLLAGDPRLGPQARAHLSDPGRVVLVSVVSFWEIVVKQRAGALRVDLDAVMRHVHRGGIRRLEIQDDHLRALRSLPFHRDHRDPFDHLLIAQAIAECAAILTADRRFASYSITVLPCADTLA